MSTSIRQPSFAGGELSPTLHGRTDLDRYGVGLRTLRNMFATKHGAAMSRPGLRYVAAAKDSGVSGNGGKRLVPFIYSDSTAYVLEFGAGYVRFFSHAGVRVFDGGVLEVATPYPAGSVAGLRFTQSGDVLWITHKDHAPHTLTREGHSTWTLEEVDFSLPDYERTAARVVDSAGSPIPTADATHPAKRWAYRVTEIRRYDSGKLIESTPDDVTTYTDLSSGPPAPTSGAVDEELVIYPDKPQTLYFRTNGLISSGLGFKLVGTRIYRGRDGVFGFVGQTEGQQDTDAGGTFKDYGSEPDYTQTPPLGRNPFEVYDSDDDLLRTEEPLVSCFYEGRQVYAGTEERPNTLWLSATNNYTDFDERLVLVADGAIEVTLASRRREQIRAVLGLDKLLVFTDSSVWAVSGAGAPISPVDLIEARVQSEVGAANLDPLVIGNSVLYVRTKGSGVRDLTFEAERNGYTGSDLTFFAQHLLGLDDEGEQLTITQWCYAEDPHGVVWALRSDGKLLSLTYEPGQGMAAWALHETDGTIEAVCSIPNGDADEVWCLVVRVVNGEAVRYIERLASREFAAVEDAVCLDAAITVEAPGSTTISGLDHLEAREVYLLVDGQVIGPKTVAAGAVDLSEDLDGEAPTLVHVGLRYDCDLELLDLAEARSRQKIVRRVFVEVEASKGIYVGETLPAAGTVDDMDELLKREVSDSYAAGELYTGEGDVTVGSATWQRHGRIALRQFDPLPLTVLGVTREVDTGGK